jgi:hypothetical protein
MNTSTIISGTTKTQTTYCLEAPYSYTDVSEVINFDAVLTTSYGYGSSGCMNSPIIEFSAIPVNTCYGTSYNSTFTKGNKYSCSNNVPSYYEYVPVDVSNTITCDKIQGQVILPTTCVTLPKLYNTSTSISYYAITQCYNYINPNAREWTETSAPIAYWSAITSDTDGILLAAVQYTNTSGAPGSIYTSSSSIIIITITMLILNLLNIHYRRQYMDANIGS